MSDHSNQSPALGILMLDTRFPRPAGDIGNPASYSFAVRYKTVVGAAPVIAVQKDAKTLLKPFVEAALELQAEGVAGITTSCGFLSLFQQDLAAVLSVPVLTSSLMQVPMVNAMLSAEKRAGILTISASSLTHTHLAAAGVPPDTPIGSTEGGREFTRAILGNETDLDMEAARADNVDAAMRMVRDHPDLGAIVLECTNMGPYAPDIRAATGLPVFSIIDCLEWFYRGLMRPRA